MKIKAFEIINHGVDHPQYFQGCGVSLTEFDHVATGVGESAREAYDDAVEILAQDGYDVDKMPKRPSGISKETLDHTDEDDESQFYVSIRVKTIPDRDVLISYLKKNAEIRLEAEYDDMPVRGNAMASDDDAFDKKVEDRIIARLDNGDVWAWAVVTVTAIYRGYEGSDTLGACCYASEKSFRRDSYFTDMKANAIASLADQLLAAKKTLQIAGIQ